MNNSEIFAHIKSKVLEVSELPHPQAPAPSYYRDPYLHIICPPEKWAECAQLIRNNENLDFDFLTMLTAVDYAQETAEEKARMDVVYHFFSFRHKHRLVVKVSVPRKDPAVPSVAGLWSAADWQEREVFDMYGIRFDGHPNLARILMWEGFPGYPLRKDYVHIPDRYDD